MILDMLFQLKSLLDIKKGIKEEGQGLVEYAMIIVLVAVAVVLLLELLGLSVADIYNNIHVNFPFP